MEFWWHYAQYAVMVTKLKWLYNTPTLTTFATATILKTKPTRHTQRHHKHNISSLYRHHSPPYRVSLYNACSRHHERAGFATPQFQNSSSSDTPRVVIISVTFSRTERKIRHFCRWRSFMAGEQGKEVLEVEFPLREFLCLCRNVGMVRSSTLA